ncbi:MAG: AarF/ABC1/UbiB kinase family protein [Clostridia bacterium]|nr:AarF/ABC1/UbiB kinase family protein [Clostridia bacterium]
MQAKLSKRTDNRERLGEIVEALRRHEIAKGMTPEKLCAVIEELGPTFVKLGQILSMRSDFLPKAYCDALSKLRAGVVPMPFEQVRAIVERAYGRPLDEVFPSFDRQALGSASIAQVHAATLPGGERVVVKVQREGIHEVMSRDITLLRRAAELVKYTPAKGLVDFNRVLDEMWVVAQQEMNFLTEAENLKTFAALNADVAFGGAPTRYPTYETATALVMENVEGIPIDDLDALREAGYDLNEIGAKLADNFVKQITEDGFFHADPHPGNIRVRDGQIVYLDMGMMGRLSERERKVIGRAVEGVARGDAEACVNAVLQLGAVKGDIDRRRLYRDCEAMLDKYAAMELGGMDLSAVVEDMVSIMKANRIGMPGGLSMLVRALATIEGVVADIAPGINVAQVAAGHVSRAFLRDFDWRGALTRDAHAVYESAYKALDIPSLLSDTLKTALKGETNLHVEYHIGADAARLVHEVTRRICAALLSAALVLAAALGFGDGLTWFAAICLAAAAGLAGYVFFRGKDK